MLHWEDSRYDAELVQGILASDDLPYATDARLPMLSYEIDGSILTLRVSGTPTLSDRQPVFDAVRADARVPRNALLLFDVRELAVGMWSEYTVVERLRVLFDQLGPKLGPACAVIAAPALTEQSRQFQMAALDFGLRVGLFNDEPSARQWLVGFVIL